MNTVVLWAIWMVTAGGVPIPLSYHATEAGCKTTLEFVLKMAPRKKAQCIPGDYAPPPNKKPVGQLV